MTWRSVLMLACGAVVVLPTLLCAQAARTPTPSALWFTVGARGASVGHKGASPGAGVTSGVLALSYQRRSLLVTARTARAESRPCVEGDCEFWVDDWAVLGGYASPVGWRLQVSGAMGVAWAARYDGYHESQGAAMAAEAQAAWRFTRKVGVGLYAWGNSSGLAGVALAVQLGRLR